MAKSVVILKDMSEVAVALKTMKASLLRKIKRVEIPGAYGTVRLVIVLYDSYYNYHTETTEHKPLLTYVWAEDDGTLKAGKIFNLAEETAKVLWVYRG